MPTPEISSDFLILDVKKGRKALEKFIREGNSLDLEIKVRIVGSWGRDDGTSIEFEGKVLEIKQCP